MYKWINHGLHLEYEISGEGIPFIFLHGMGGSVKQIQSTYEPLEGVCLINLNQQGHGESEACWEKFDFDHLADDVCDLMDRLEIKKAYFAGISMGAAVCLNLAVRYPQKVEKFLLIRNAWTDHPMSDKVQKAYYDLGACLQEGGIERFYTTEGWQIVKEPSAYTCNAFTSPFEDKACVKYWQKYQILPEKTPIPNVEVLKNIQVPVTILACRNDLCHPYEYGEYLAKHIPGTVLLEIPDKDKDGALHKQMINEAIREMLF